MDKIHQANLILRDLKANNLLLNQDGHVRLIDLEFMIPTGAQQSKAGTPDYMAPELF